MKKAQLTTFISIFVILLIAVALFLFIRGYLLRDIEPDRVLPIEMKDVETYVEDCLKQTSREAIELLGFQGGFVYIPNYITLTRDSYIDFIPGSDLKVPLWYYLGDLRMPFLSQIENDIDQYIIENLPQCINNFEVFDNKYSISDYDIQPNTYISPNDVLVNLRYPLTVTNLATEQVGDQINFAVRHDVQLRKMYELAYEIFINNQALGFLEEVAIDLMVIDPEIPFNGLEFSCRRLQWELNDLRERTKQLFEFNFPLIRINQTNYIPFREDEQYESLHMLWDLSTSNNYKDFVTTIEFNPNNDFYMNARPSDGQYLRSSMGDISFLRMFCLNNYQFTYDLRFPLKINLFDERSFSGEGYQFVFSLPVYVERNQPIGENFGFSLPTRLEEDEEFCSFRLDETHIFRAYDKRYNMGIENVELYFDCIIKRCYLGNTTFDGFNYQLETSLPEYCSGGFLVAEHPDYETSRELLYYDNLPAPISVTMREMKTLDLEIYRRVSDNIALEFSIIDNYLVLLSLKDYYNNESTYLTYPVGNDTIRIPYDDSNMSIEMFLIDKELDFILGGYKSDWNYSRDDIADANKVIFNVYEHELHPIDEEQSMQLYDFVLNETKHFEVLKPRFE